MTSASVGILVFNGATGTVTNSGLITGTGGTAVQLGGGDDAMLIQSGAVSLQGTVDGGAGVNTLTFGAGGGTLTGTGLDFERFSNIGIAAGGTWGLAGTGTIGAGIILTATGRLNVLGSLTNAGRINVASYDALRVASALTNAGTILTSTAFGVDGGAGAIVTNTGSIGASTGIGIRLAGGNGTVVSAGRITGQSTAVSFSGGNSLLVLRNGYSFGGVISASGAGNAVRLQGSAGSTVTATYSALRLSGFGTVGFAAGAGNYATLRITRNTVLPGTISNFIGLHDTIDLAGLTPAAGTTAGQFDGTTNRLTIAGQNGSVTLQLDSENYAGIGWVASSDGAGGTAVHAQSVVAPTITGTTAGQAVNDNVTRQPFSGVTVADTNGAAASVVATVTLTAGGAASDAGGTLSGAGLSKTGIGTYAVSAARPPL